MANLDLFEWKDERYPIDFIESLIFQSESFLLKKLARNDCSWADDPKKHQGGPFLPKGAFGKKFFPQLKNINGEKRHIFETIIEVEWPGTSETKQCRLVHYSNKGSEQHLTRVPKPEFSNLTPASYLLIAKKTKRHAYIAVVIDSATSTAEWIEDKLELKSDFSCELFLPDDIRAKTLSQQELLVQAIIQAIKNDQLQSLINSYSMRSTDQLAVAAQELYLEKVGASSLSPYEIASPGDAIRTISRDLEFELYKEDESKLLAVQFANSLVLAHGINTRKDAVKSIVKCCSNNDLYSVFKSASQKRVSRAGRSFELHLSTVMRNGEIAFDAQVKHNGRRPDFVLPGAHALKANESNPGRAYILSAKTTLKERWKQIVLEDYNCPVFLATLDERITKPALDQMLNLNITVVVPESLKKSKITNYKKHAAVISYRSFFDDVKDKWGVGF
jgi:hypothetical protein